MLLFTLFKWKMVTFPLLESEFGNVVCQCQSNFGLRNTLLEATCKESFCPREGKGKLETGASLCPKYSVDINGGHMSPTFGQPTQFAKPRTRSRTLIYILHLRFQALIVFVDRNLGQRMLSGGTWFPDRDCITTHFMKY